ncbi:MAG: hypothetical protein ABIL09_10605, partial [Gemmatimonadota bacterium]
PPRVQERLYDVLVLPAVIARGQLQATGNWRALLLEDAWPLEGIFGGYAGFAASRGHQGRLATEAAGMERSTARLEPSEPPLAAESRTGSD